MEKVIVGKSYSFALRIVKAYKFLIAEKKEFVLTKQLLRSGTAIGALVREAEHAESKMDFIHKMSIALKEANETDYWLSILKDSKYLTVKQFESLAKDCDELLRLLVSIIKTSKANLQKKKNL